MLKPRASRIDLAIADKLIETRRALYATAMLMAAREGLTHVSDKERDELFDVLKYFTNNVYADEQLAAELIEHS